MFTSNFRRISLGNLLIFVSQYMLIPILPVVMAEKLGLSIATTGVMFLVMTLGMILVGPFFSYLMDTYRRRSLCLLAFAVVLVATAGYALVSRPLELYLLCFIHGIAFGVATSSIITLGIDVNVSDNRSRGNLVFGWLTRLGMILGAGLGSAIFMNYGFEAQTTVSIGIGVVGILAISMMKVPFRAPIGTSVCTLDRFFLPRTFVFVLNMILVAFVPGVLFPLIHFKIRDTFLLDEWTVPYFAIAGGAFLLSALFARAIKKLSVWLKAVTGMTGIIGAICCLMLFNSVHGQLLSAILLGLGLSMVTPAFLLLFINLSSHCQRSTANTTHLLSWKIGLSLGIAASCYLTANSSSMQAFRAALFSSVLAVLFFIIVSYPYYLKKKVR